MANHHLVSNSGKRRALIFMPGVYLCECLISKAGVEQSEAHPGGSQSALRVDAL